MARGRPSKKQHIIDTALSLFIGQGYQGTSIDQVVQVAGVSKPTVYSNFSSKQILWNQVLERILQTTHDDLKNLSLAHTDGLLNWRDLWQMWVNSPARLAVYRVMLGERRKMEEQAVSQFEQLQALFEQHLKQLPYVQSLTQTSQFTLKAYGHQIWLLPMLYRTPALSESALNTQLAVLRQLV